MKRGWVKFGSLVFLSVFCFEIHGETEFGLKGYFRSRYESKENGFGAPEKDAGVGLTRLNLMTSLSLEKTAIFFNPQFSRIWGARQDGDASSGGLKDPVLNVHQAFLSRRMASNVEFVAGRKELNFGDQLLVGGVGWHHIGRSFDLVEINTSLYGMGDLKVFFSNTLENDLDSAVETPQDFGGVYFSGNNEKILDEYDIYILNKTLNQNQQTKELDNLTTYGVRLAKNLGAGSLKGEYALQGGRVVEGDTKNGEYVYNVEATVEFGRIKAHANLNAASKDFDQLYPTAHKWLGFADQFSRRNISSYVIGVTHKQSDVWSLSLMHHVFRRVDTGAPAYNFGAKGLGNVGDAAEVAAETDFVLRYVLDAEMAIMIGYSLVEPLAYLKEQGTTDTAHWGFLQLSAAF